MGQERFGSSLKLHAMLFARRYGRQARKGGDGVLGMRPGGTVTATRHVQRLVIRSPGLAVSRKWSMVLRRLDLHCVRISTGTPRMRLISAMSCPRSAFKVRRRCTSYGIARETG